MSKLLGFALAALLAITAPVWAQTGIDTSHIVRCSPSYPLQLTDLVLVTRGGASCNALYNLSALPVATLSTNGISHPDGTTITISGNGTLSTVATPDSTDIGTVTTANPRISGAATSGFYTPAASTIAIELNGAPAMRWKTLSAGVDYLTVTPGKSGTNAKLGLGGTTTNQGLEITSTGSASVSINGVAFTNAGIMTAGTWQGNVIQPSYLATSTSSALGIGRPDNSTLTVSAGVWSAVGSGTVSLSTTSSSVDYNLVFATTTTGNLPLYATTSVSVNASTKVLSSGGFNSTTSTTGYQLGGNTGLWAPGGDTQSIGVGNGSLASQTSGSRANTAVGYQAGGNLTTGVSNVFVGAGAASGGTPTGTGNTFVGKGVGPTLLSGSNNTYIGYLAGTINNVAGDNNTLIGANALVALSSTTSALAVGVNAVAGSKDVAIGPNALSGTTTNNNGNTALGYNSGKKITTGQRNLILGPDVASTTLTIGSNNILIGTTSGLDTTTSSTSDYFAVANGGTALMWATSTNAATPLHLSGGLYGTATGDTSCADCWAYILDSTTTVGSAVALTDGVPSNVTTITLPPGDWDINGLVFFEAAGSTVTTTHQGALSISSTGFPSYPNSGGAGRINNPAAGGSPSLNLGPWRQALSATTTIYLKASANFTVSTQSAFGYLRAERRR